ncbi:SDR family NAD(P)-dependent oxidoreductase [Patescibacteria group bacterium]|nr:MAG: SDR family NAD(P)-dependent oxidoreductase [Patescibacteria group bacterium]
MKTVLITGISRGIGRSLAERFLAEGYFVVGTSLSGGVDLINHNLTVLKLDLRTQESISSCAQEIVKSGKNIDMLINNAGVLLDEDETTVVVDRLRQTLEVNLLGTVDFTERIVPVMAPSSHIINISSTAGSLEQVGKTTHFPGHYPSYKISKAALNMYTRTLALRLKDKGVVVSSVHPGWVKTDMGGENADLSPADAAQQIFNFAISKPETGQFWFAGKKLAW